MRPIATELPGSLIRELANANMGRADVIPLWFGEGDMPTDPAIAEAAAASLARGETFYGPNLGLPELREALTHYQQRHFETSAGFDNIAVTNSGLNALLLVLSALVDPGDDVVVAVPAWPNLVAMPKVLSATVTEVPITLEDGAFALPVERLLEACSDKTRVVLLNSPSNPTGWRMPAADMARLVAELEDRGIWLIADEVYSRILPAGAAPASFLEYFAEDRRIVTVNSFSKSWAMTGWRLGWITAPRVLIEALERLIEFNTSCAPAFVQHGGIAALGPAGEAFLSRQLERLEAARIAAEDELAKEPGISVPRCDGAFYLFPRIDGVGDGLAFARRAIENGVGIAPGEAFVSGGKGHMRLCFARDPDQVREAMRRLVRTVRES